MEITTEMIKQLRAATSAPMLDCRKALQEANGDYQKAVDWLREKGMATAAKRADRDASNGVVEISDFIRSMNSSAPKEEAEP